MPRRSSVKRKTTIRVGKFLSIYHTGVPLQVKILWIRIEEHSLKLGTKYAIWLLFAMTYTCLAHTQAAEQMETGQTHLANGKEITYRIRLLPLASFPELPPAISAQLVQRHCLIPQTYQAKRPENVIHGAFIEKGSDDWAALCSQDGTTTLYVISGNQPTAPIALRSQKNSEWLGTRYSASPNYGSAWGIALRKPSEIRFNDKHQLRAAADHDGIEDAFLEKSSTIHYCEDGNWIILDASN